MFRHTIGWILLTLLAMVGSAGHLQAAPSVADALSLTPKQPNIAYDTPSAAEIDRCTMKAEKINGATAWVVRAANGDVLRLFSDTDGDMVVDTWCYYQAGLEVYRDLDADHNGKYDQYRWFHSAGTRWGLNTDEDEANTIDDWKLISPEETAEEVVAALKAGDSKRFHSLLLTRQDIAGLGLAKAQAEKLAARVQAATETFKKLTSSGELDNSSEFSDFGGLKPGMVPAGTRGSTKDLMVYENAWAMVKTDSDHRQLQLGTMISVKGAWKLIDGPSLDDSEMVASGFFFVPGGGGAGESVAGMTTDAPTERVQELLEQLEKLDQQIVSAADKDKPGLNAKRAKMLHGLADAASNAAEREQWLRQLADMVSAAAQDGDYPEGIDFLKRMEARLSRDEDTGDLAAYFQFHRMLAEYYGVTLAEPGVDYAKAQAEWQTDLEAFVEQHPKSSHGAEAVRMLAMGSEMSGEIDEAVAWYRRILKDFPDSSSAAMSRGAVVRLTSEGREISLQGKAIKGDAVDLKKLRGKVVVIQYWTSSSEVCKADQAVLKDLYAKYGGRGLEIVGVNLDYNRSELLTYLESNRLPWAQLYEPGGFESRLATELGVVTVPLMLMVGPDGKVISSNIQAAEIEAALKEAAPERTAKR